MLLPAPKVQHCWQELAPSPASEHSFLVDDIGDGCAVPFGQRHIGLIVELTAGVAEVADLRGRFEAITGSLENEVPLIAKSSAALL